MCPFLFLSLSPSPVLSAGHWSEGFGRVSCSAASVIGAQSPARSSLSVGGLCFLYSARVLLRSNASGQRVLRRVTTSRHRPAWKVKRNGRMWRFRTRSRWSERDALASLPGWLSDASWRRKWRESLTLIRLYGPIKWPSIDFKLFTLWFEHLSGSILRNQ